jgi:hypothetical protein
MPRQTGTVRAWIWEPDEHETIWTVTLVADGATVDTIQVPDGGYCSTPTWQPSSDKTLYLWGTEQSSGGNQDWGIAWNFVTMAITSDLTLYALLIQEPQVNRYMYRFNAEDAWTVTDWAGGTFIGSSFFESIIFNNPNLWAFVVGGFVYDNQPVSLIDVSTCTSLSILYIRKTPVLLRLPPILISVLNIDVFVPGMDMIIETGSMSGTQTIEGIGDSICLESTTVKRPPGSTFTVSGDIMGTISYENL